MITLNDSFEFQIDNYVFKKISDEWIECRVISFTTEKVILYVLKNFEIIQSNLNEIFPSTIETIRKFKINNIKPNGLYANNKLKKTIEDDGNAILKMQTIEDLNLSMISINSIFEDFQIFLLKNKPTIYADELTQFVKYLQYVFDKFIQNTLLSSLEKEYIQKKQISPLDFYKPIHLLRLSVFLQEVLLKDLNDEGIVEICNDFLVYFIDFLGLKYFNEND